MTEGGSQGLFVVVAVIIFGIFVSIAYLLFDDTLKPALAGIFKDGIFQAEEKLDGKGTENLPGGDDSLASVVDGVKENPTTKEIYAMIRPSNEVNGESKVWVQMDLERDTEGNNYYSIKNSGLESPEESTAFGSGNASMTGSLTIPEYVKTNSGSLIPIKKISASAFKASKFDGDFIAPSILDVGKDAFYNSKFTSYSAEKLETAGENAFYTSTFKKGEVASEFNSYNIKEVGDSAFRGALFTGSFIANELNTVGNYSFYMAKFNNKFDAKNIETIGRFSFYYAEFQGDFIAPKLKTMGDYNFNSSRFTGNLIVPNLERISVSFQSQDVAFDGYFISKKDISISYIGPASYVLGGTNSKFKKCNAKVPSSYSYKCAEVDPDFVPEGFGLE